MRFDCVRQWFIMKSILFIICPICLWYLALQNFTRIWDFNFPLDWWKIMRAWELKGTILNSPAHRALLRTINGTIFVMKSCIHTSLLKLSSCAGDLYSHINSQRGLLFPEEQVCLLLTLLIHASDVLWSELTWDMDQIVCHYESWT